MVSVKVKMNDLSQKDMGYTAMREVQSLAAKNPKKKQNTSILDFLHQTDGISREAHLTNSVLRSAYRRTVSQCVGMSKAKQHCHLEFEKRKASTY